MNTGQLKISGRDGVTNENKIGSICEKRRTHSSVGKLSAVQWSKNSSCTDCQGALVHRSHT